MLTRKRNTWFYLSLLSALLAAGLCRDVRAQTKTDLQSSKKIYAVIAFDDALGGASDAPRAVYPLHGVGAQKLNDRLKRTTTASLPKGPQGGIEVTFIAVIAQDGKVLAERTSHPVRIDGASLRLVDSSGIGEIDSPWEAFDEPALGLFESALGRSSLVAPRRDALVAPRRDATGLPIEIEMGRPLTRSIPYEGDGITTRRELVEAWLRSIQTALPRGSYELVLFPFPTEDPGQAAIRPAILPFQVKEQ